ncbi:MAG: TonB-dependent receptor [Pseudohongiellaceae bacterium]|nr:TonB-dependent receptor [Pseudohongiellaceae bacterium]
MKCKHLSLSLPVLVNTISLPLIAQDLEPQQEHATVIEEILVSAQRRSQPGQELGLSLNIIDEEAIERGNFVSLPDIAYYLSNVEMFEDFGGQGLPVWVIRGVGLQDFNANNTPTAAIYIDEVYQSSSAQGGRGLFDTRQVEVLKGPQGGLYGRNTSGGVVRQMSNRASLLGPSGDLAMTLGSWQEVQLKGAVNIPVSGSSAVRIAGQSITSEDAWQKSLVNKQHHGEKDLWDARLWWLTQLSSESTVEFKLYAGENNSQLPLAQSVALYDVSGDYCAPVYQGRRDDSECINYANLVRSFEAKEPLLPVSQQASDGSTSLSNDINALDNDYMGLSAYYTRELSLGGLGNAEMQIIANTEAFNYGMSFDYDGSSTELGHQVAHSDIDTHSLELRLVSVDETRLNWQVGALISNERFVEDRQFLLADNSLVGLVRGQLDYTQSTKSRAVYAQGEYDISDTWSVNASLRYSDETKQYRDGSVLAPAFPAPFDVLVGHISDDYDLDDHWSGSLGSSWQLSHNTMLYGSISKGFKVGGFFGGFIFDPLEFAPYDEETVYAYELGVKTLLLASKLQLNAATFWYDYRDVQGFRNVSVMPTNGGGSLVLERLSTLGDAQHSGIDVDATWLIGNAWTLTAGFSYLDARITDSDAFTVNLLGDAVSTKGERPYSPHWSAYSSLSYETTVGTDLNLLSSISWHYRGDFSGHLSSDVDKAVSSLPGYALVDANVSLSSPDGNWMASAYVKNLTDKVYTPRKVYDSLGSYVDIMGQSRSYGLQLSYHW